MAYATDPVSDLLNLLDVERLELNLFRGQSGGEGVMPRIYGGQVIAQALMAAYRTVEGRACHSLHAYFIRPGDPSIPVIYEVDRARDGGSFATRRVIAVQHGRQIFNLAASFHIEEGSWEHQHDMPAVAKQPEALETRAERRRKLVEETGDSRFAGPDHEHAIDIREVAPVDLMNPVKTSDSNQAWMKVSRPIDESPAVHQCLLAYASDMNLLSSGVRRHGVTWRTGDVMQASLDHAMWFHRPVKFDDWVLYAMDSPFGGGARSFNRGSVYTRDGVLVASVAQEGLMRPLRKKG